MHFCFLPDSGARRVRSALTMVTWTYILRFKRLLTLACCFRIGLWSSPCLDWWLVQTSGDGLFLRIWYLARLALRFARHKSILSFHDLLEHSHLRLFGWQHVRSGLPSDAPGQHWRAFIAYCLGCGPESLHLFLFYVLKCDCTNDGSFFMCYFQRTTTSFWELLEHQQAFIAYFQDHGHGSFHCCQFYVL